MAGAYTSNPTMVTFSSIGGLVLLLLVILLVVRAYRSGSREHGLPPGPPTLPVIGNLHMYPAARAHLKYVFILSTILNLNRSSYTQIYRMGKGIWRYLLGR